MPESNEMDLVLTECNNVGFGIYISPASHAVAPGVVGHIGVTAGSSLKQILVALKLINFNVCPS